MSQAFDFENLVELCRRTHEETQRSGRETICSAGISSSMNIPTDAPEAGKSLRDTMLEISRNAQRRVLTPEILQSILADE